MRGGGDGASHSLVDEPWKRGEGVSVGAFAERDGGDGSAGDRNHDARVVGVGIRVVAAAARVVGEVVEEVAESNAGVDANRAAGFVQDGARGGAFDAPRGAAKGAPASSSRGWRGDASNVGGDDVKGGVVVARAEERSVPRVAHAVGADAGEGGHRGGGLLHRRRFRHHHLARARVLALEVAQVVAGGAELGASDKREREEEGRGKGGGRGGEGSSVLATTRDDGNVDVRCARRGMRAIALIGGRRAIASRGPRHVARASVSEVR